MAALIKPKEKVSKKKINIQISEDVLNDLELYQECIGESDQGYIIQEALKKLFKAKEFQQWKKERVKNKNESSEEIE